jgi:hypothetical protein
MLGNVCTAHQFCHIHSITALRVSILECLCWMLSYKEVGQASKLKYKIWTKSVHKLPIYEMKQYKNPFCLLTLITMRHKNCSTTGTQSVPSFSTGFGQNFFHTGIYLNNYSWDACKNVRRSAWKVSINTVWLQPKL